MKENITRILVETTIRNYLKEIKTNPNRGTRNLVDMALNFSEGRFQQYLFETTRKMLTNEQSAYYELIKDTVSNVNSDTLLTFGMNLGYNSCTSGAKTIRQIEEAEQFNIPWCLSLGIDDTTFKSMKASYEILLAQGREMGIYTWLLFCENLSTDVLSLITEFPDCAFIIITSGSNITEDFIKRTASVHNIMFAVKYDSFICPSCAMLRKNHALYSVYVPYKTEDITSIRNNSLLNNIEKIHPVFTFFHATSTVWGETQENVYDAIKRNRLKQDYRTFPMDLVFDTKFIDSIISNDSCIAGFDTAGQFYTDQGKAENSSQNFLNNDLKNILMLAFPKNL